MAKLEEIADFIQKTAKVQENKIEKLEQSKEVKKLLESFSTDSKKEFTFTIGEMNAYLG